MVIAVDLGGTNIRVARVKDGVIVQSVVKPSPSTMSLDDSILYFKSVVRELFASDVTGIGIGVPSVVDVENGIVYNVINIPSWERVELKAILEQEFEVPVFVNNDANCFALGECRYGEGRGFKDVVGLTVGTGVGAGIVVGSELYNGSNAAAGEVGCIEYLDGDYESYCSSRFFERYSTTGVEAAKLAVQGNSEAIKMWEEFGDHLGKLLHTVLFAYDPQIIVFGGGLTSAYSLFEKSMFRRLYKFAYPSVIKNLIVKPSSNPQIAILGAAALVK